MKPNRHRSVLFTFAALLAPSALSAPALAQGTTKAKASPFTDFRAQNPGAVHHIRPSDLPPPNATESTDSGRKVIDRPKDAWPKAPPGFKVELFADKLEHPRLIRTAPNGDLFVAESRADLVRVFRGIGPDGRAKQTKVFAKELRQPFGIAFYPPKGEPHPRLRGQHRRGGALPLQER